MSSSKVDFIVENYGRVGAEQSAVSGEAWDLTAIEEVRNPFIDSLSTEDLSEVQRRGVEVYLHDGSEWAA